MLDDGVSYGGRIYLKETGDRMCRNSMNIFKMRTILDLIITIRIKLSNQFWPKRLFPHKLHF